MKKTFRRQRSLWPVLGNIALVIVGVAVALGLMELLLRRYPSLVPTVVRTNPPVRSYHAFRDETYDVLLSSGDLKYWMRGSIAPITKEKDQVVARVHLVTDEYGFRNIPPQKAAYDIVAVGDSYTFGHNVPTPWPQKLAESTGTDVLNLGDGDTGPQAQVDILREYGLNKHSQWVIMAYFEGNDLHDVETYDQAGPFILTRFGNYVLGQGMQAWRGSRVDRARTTTSPVYRYPITLTIHDTDLEMAFVSSYIAWLAVSGKALEASRNYRIATRSILDARDLSEAAGNRFLLVYFPSKEHVYLSYLNDPDIVKRVFTDVPALEPNEVELLQFTNKTVDVELARQHSEDQAELLAQFAAQNHIHFLNLTPYFQEAASTGAELYYPFDTHWNQRGQDLTAQNIANFLAQYIQ